MSEVVFGIHAVKSVLSHQAECVSELYCAEGKLNARVQALVAHAEKNHVTIRRIPAKELSVMCQAQKHQGVVVKMAAGTKMQARYDLMTLLDQLEEPPLLLVLDCVQDPHNLGACMRSADAAGVHAIIAPKDKATGVTSVVRNVACGAADTVPFFQVSNLSRTLEALKERGIWLYGAAGEATETIYQEDLTGPAALVLGAEAEGLRRLTRETCDKLIKIPMVGFVESLNVSVATGVILFEVLRQRQG